MGIGFWDGKCARIHINKDGEDLFFTAKILEETSYGITFIDKKGIPYYFPHEYIKQKRQIEDFPVSEVTKND